MKALFLVTTCLIWHTASFGQTSPTTPAGSVSGTKNVGADRADAPQAPGMTTAAGTRSASTPSAQPRRSTNQQRPKQLPARKQSPTQASPQ